ncbi:MAG: accessory gene regulator B family protein [Ruminococcus callidus]
MLEHLSKRFAGKLICAGIISEADADVYVYGFFQGMMLLLNVITTLLLGILFQQLLLCMLLNCSIHTNSDQRWWSSCRQSLSMLYQFYHHDCDFACGN